jgi:hypothetical protein
MDGILKHGDLVEYSFQGEPWQLGRFIKDYWIGHRYHLLIERQNTDGSPIRHFPTYVAFKPTDVRLPGGKEAKREPDNPNLSFKMKRKIDEAKERQNGEKPRHSAPSSKWRKHVKTVTGRVSVADKNKVHFT